MSVFQAYLPQIVIGMILVVVVAIVLVVAMVVKLRNLHTRVEALTAGADGASLEQSIVANGEKLAQLDTEMQEFYHIASTIHTLAHRGIHRTGFLRFNPFKDLGGDQSFALALMDGKANGVVISSLHTREGTRVYAKAIADGDAVQHPFSDEEKKVIAGALADSKTVSDNASIAIDGTDRKD